MIINFKDKEVNVKEQLTLTDAMVLSKLVVDNVFNDDEYVPIYRELMIIRHFLTFYTDMEVPDLGELYTNMEEYKDFISDATTLDDFNYLQYDELINSINELIEFRKEQIIHKSAMDDAFLSLSTLLSTLNEKAKELDVKKLEKVLKKLNPQEIVKAYQKSGIGESVRDKAIQEQSQKIIELEKQVGARNVVTDKQVK